MNNDDDILLGNDNNKSISISPVRLSSGDFQHLANPKKNNQELYRFLLPLDTALQSMPKICISKEYQLSFNQGQKIMLPSKDTYKDQNIRVYDYGGQFVGLGCIENDGFLKPTRVFNLNLLIII